MKMDYYCLNDDIGFVKLMQHVGDDLSIVNSARVCYNDKSDSINDKDRKLIKFLLDNKHETPLEHNSMTFLVKCPLFVARQWHRHRIGISINEVSGRYTVVPDEIYVPSAIFKEFRIASKSNKQVSELDSLDTIDQESCREIYAKSTSQAFEAYHQLIAHGVAREQARAVLPLATYTQFYWTCNLRSLLHFINLRDHKDAQWEIQQYAKNMLEQAKDIFPETINILLDKNKDLN